MIIETKHNVGDTVYLINDGLLTQDSISSLTVTAYGATYNVFYSLESKPPFTQTAVAERRLESTPEKAIALYAETLKAQALRDGLLVEEQ